MTEPDGLVLPCLRQDIDIQTDYDSSTGQPSFVIHDPLQHRYFKIDAATHQVLNHWQPGQEAEAFSEDLKTSLNLEVSAEQIKQLIQFLVNSNLAEMIGDSDWKMLSKRQEQTKLPLQKKILMGHLFFKLPLFKPQSFLRATSPLVSPLFSPTIWFVIMTAGLAGLYLASRQWHEFTASFFDMISLQGTIYFVIALVFVKIAHELGHAYTAHRFGCVVPQMGIAFMLFMPMLYTDVSDTWRLKSKRQRMLVSGAGVLAELGLAMLATLLWVFLDDGVMREIVFVIATTSWVLSLFVNLNPCMKFDGYYLLSDYLGIDNMQTRAFALLRWKFRKMLFAPGLPVPEKVSVKLRGFLIGYAIATFIYRVTLAFAIIFMVYHFTFKLLALGLLVLETWLLLVRPALNELLQWRKVDGRHVSAGRAYASAAITCACAVLFLVPLPGRVEVPAVLQAGDLAQIYPTQPARIVSIHVQENDVVEPGDPILVLEDEALKTDIRSARLKLGSIKAQLARAIASSRDKSDWLVLNEEMHSQQALLEGLEKRKAELVLRAPIAGKIIQFDQTLHADRWVGRDTLVALVAGGHDTAVTGYAEETALDRVTTASVGKFIPDDITRSSLSVKINSVSQAALRKINRPELLATYGGPIEVDKGQNQEQFLSDPHYLIEMSLQHPAQPPNQLVPGIVTLQGKSQSLAHKVWLNVGKVLIREVGF